MFHCTLKHRTYFFLNLKDYDKGHSVTWCFLFECFSLYYARSSLLRYMSSFTYVYQLVIAVLVDHSKKCLFRYEVGHLITVISISTDVQLQYFHLRPNLCSYIRMRLYTFLCVDTFTILACRCLCGRSFICGITYMTTLYNYDVILNSASLYKILAVLIYMFSS